jgi:hypothetical protein
MLIDQSIEWIEMYRTVFDSTWTDADFARNSVSEGRMGFYWACRCSLIEEKVRRVMMYRGDTDLVLRIETF